MNGTETFQHYQVLRREDGSLWELGRGAMGVTYKAFDTDLHCEVALKVILPPVLHNEDSQRRFLREARLAARLRHPNIAAIFHLGQTADGTSFYAMEFCEGETLQQIVERRGPFDVASALNLALQISRALVLANQHSLVHRDIKPSNLILTHSPADEPTVKIIDFGLAKSYLAEASTWASMGTAGFIGTAHFASPEQLENEPVDGRSDIYSLGATLWFLLTGRSMFGGSLARIISQHLASSPPWVQLDAYDVPPSVQALLARTLEKKPANRFRDALELRRALEDCLAGMATGGIPRPVAVPAEKTEDAPVPDEADVVLANRWQLVEPCGGGHAGTLFRALDLRHGSRFVAVRVLDGPLSADPEARQRLERAVDTLRTAPHENLVRPLAFGEDGARGRFLVTEWIEGFTLLAVLRARGTLTLPDTLRLLEGMAAGFDHARRHGLNRLEWSKHQILLHFPEGFDDEQHRERTLHLPLADWPPFRVVLGALPLQRPISDGDDTLVGVETRLPAPEGVGASDTSGETPAAGLEVAALGWLTYELLGGISTEAVQGLEMARVHYAPLSQLTEAGNAVLRRAVRPAAGDVGFPTAREFYEALEATVGTGTARPGTVRPVPPLPPVAEPALGDEARLASGRRWPWLAALAAFAVAGTVFYFVSDRSSPPVRSAKAASRPTASPSGSAPVRTATPALANEPTPAPALTPPLVPTPVPVAEPSPMPALVSEPTPTPALADARPPTSILPEPEPAAATPQPPVASTETPPPPLETPGTMSLPGTVDASPVPEMSPPAAADAAPSPEAATPPPPEGRLEQVESSPQRDLRLEYRRTADGTSLWLVPLADESRRRLLYTSSGEARALFSPDEQWLLVSDRSPGEGGVQLFRRARGDDALYEIPDDFQRPGARLDDLAWGFYLAMTSLPPRTSREHVRIEGVDWQPDSSALTLRLTAADPAGAESVPVPWLGRYDLATRRFEAATDLGVVRDALAARERGKSRPAAATPPAAPASPAGDWRKQIADFTEGFVHSDQTRDVRAALAYYAPIVDYFGDGRVNQAHIRADILRFNGRWPVQRNRLVGDPEVREVKPGRSYTVRFRIAFSDESASRQAAARGESALEMRVEVFQGVPMIVSIREKSVRREKGTVPAR